MKNIKVDSEVHSKLKNRKEKNDSFNDVLRDLLDLQHEVDNDLGAYFPSDEMREAAKQILDVIENKGSVEKDVDTEQNHKEVTFISEETGAAVATCTFREDRMGVSYRTMGDKMKKIGTLMENEERGVYGFRHSQRDLEDFLDEIEQKVSGSWRKWGRDQ